MTSVEAFEPAMCYSTEVCRPSVDTAAVPVRTLVDRFLAPPRCRKPTTRRGLRVDYRLSEDAPQQLCDAKPGPAPVSGTSGGAR